jgi:tRNA A37 threonylcarbamoyladenosine biosynthesis protein TsaE
VSFFTPLNRPNPVFNIVENYEQNVALFQQQLYRLSTGEDWNFRQKA